jgi:hypothetical protein
MRQIGLGRADARDHTGSATAPRAVAFCPSEGSAGLPSETGASRWHGKRPSSELENARSKSNAKHEQADQARPNRQQPRLISRYAGTREAGQAAGDGSDDPEPGIGAIFLRLAGARLAADFFAAPFLPADFFAVDRLAEPFFAEAFFTAPLRVAFLATTLRADFLAGFLAADFFAVFFVAAFGMYHVPLNHLLAAQIVTPCRCMRESTFVFISRKRCTRAQCAPRPMTIELSRALGSLIVHWRERSHAALHSVAAIQAWTREASTQQSAQVPTVLALP